ncbi:MAG: hypothetical protein HWE07_10270 [Cytophagia bacterium]|nr:hypothetical protein [Cytophagia bacterium]
MKRLLTYLFVVVLFAVCVFHNNLIPDNLSDRFLGEAKQNEKKDRQELLDNMKEITRQGLVHFEVYDEAGELIAILKKPEDFDHKDLKSVDYKNFSIKSVSNTNLLSSIQLSTSLN